MSRPRLALGLTATICLLGLEVHAAAHAVAYLAPLLVLLLSLVAGHYPGSEALCRAAARSRGGRHRRVPFRSGRTGRGWIDLLPRGGRLVGAALAGRGPPPSPVCGFTKNDSRGTPNT